MCSVTTSSTNSIIIIIMVAQDRWQKNSIIQRSDCNGVFFSLSLSMLRCLDEQSPCIFFYFCRLRLCSMAATNWESNVHTNFASKCRPNDETRRDLATPLQIFECIFDFWYVSPVECELCLDIISEFWSPKIDVAPRSIVCLSTAIACENPLKRNFSIRYCMQYMWEGMEHELANIDRCATWYSNLSCSIRIEINGWMNESADLFCSLIPFDLRDHDS